MCLDECNISAFERVFCGEHIADQVVLVFSARSCAYEQLQTIPWNACATFWDVVSVRSDLLRSLDCHGEPDV